MVAAVVVLDPEHRRRSPSRTPTTAGRSAASGNDAVLTTGDGGGMWATGPHRDSPAGTTAVDTRPTAPPLDRRHRRARSCAAPTAARAGPRRSRAHPRPAVAPSNGTSATTACAPSAAAARSVRTTNGGSDLGRRWSREPPSNLFDIDTATAATSGRSAPAARSDSRTTAGTDVARPGAQLRRLRARRLGVERLRRLHGR